MSIYWVRPDNCTFMHALAHEVPHGVEVTATALCGQQVHVLVRPWFVVIRCAPKDCPSCRALVDQARGRPTPGAKREWRR